MFHPFFVFVCLLFLSSCSRPSESRLSRFYDDGRTKPALAMTPVIDATSFELPWSLSEEFTSLMTRRLSDYGSIFVVPKGELGYADNPFGSDLNWIKREFPEDEFAVFCELVEHEQVPDHRPSRTLASSLPFETAFNLKMAVRLRVVDLRGITPKIVLQQNIQHTYYLPKHTVPVDYKTTSWGTDGYPSSPMAIAHGELAAEIASRVNEYLLLAKSR